MDYPSIQVTLYVGLLWAQAYFLLQKAHLIEAYGTLLGLSKKLKLVEYREWELKNPGQSYLVYLRCTYTSWAAGLLGCPFCFITFGCVWSFIIIGLLKLDLLFSLLGLVPSFVGCVAYMLVIWLYSKVFSS